MLLSSGYCGLWIRLFLFFRYWSVVLPRNTSDTIVIVHQETFGFQQHFYQGSSWAAKPVLLGVSLPQPHLDVQDLQYLLSCISFPALSPPIDCEDSNRPGHTSLHFLVWGAWFTASILIAVIKYQMYFQQDFGIWTAFSWRSFDNFLCEYGFSNQVFIANASSPTRW